MSETHPLNSLYPELHSSIAVEGATQDLKNLGKEVPEDKGYKIEAWMGQLEGMLGVIKSSQESYDGLKLLFRKAYITGTDDLTLRDRIMRRNLAHQNSGLGIAPEKIDNNEVEKEREIVVKDQQESLDAWLDYLTGEGSAFPMWFRYYVIRNVVNLAEFNKYNDKFPKRSYNTTARFPEINPEALAYMQDSISNHFGLNSSEKDREGEEIGPTEELLEGGINFAKLYKRAIDYAAPKNVENLDSTRGEWRLFRQASDEEQAKELAQTLHSYGTGWCIGGQKMAEYFLERGDIYIFYSESDDGQAIVPRLAIAMSGSGKYARFTEEIRGIAKGQNVEGVMLSTLETKMEEIDPVEAKKFKKRSEDMKRLTEVFSKFEKEGSLSRDDLIFLYGIDHKVEGFGEWGEEDPRIDKIKNSRDYLQDMHIIYQTEDDNLIVQNLINIGYGEDVLYHLGMFNDLDHNALAIQMISKGEGGLLLSYLGRLDGLDLRQIALKLIETKQAKELAREIEWFDGMDKETAVGLMAVGYDYIVAKNIVRFVNLDHQNAMVLIVKGYDWEVARNLDSFVGLDEEIARILISKRRGRYVAKRRELFSGLSVNTLAELETIKV